MKKEKALSGLPNVFEGATFFVGDKKVREGRFWKEVANDILPAKKRIIKIKTVKQLLSACPNIEVFGEEIKKYVITKGGRLMLWEDWYKRPHPLISKTEDAEYEIVVKKLLPNKRTNRKSTTKK